MEESINKQLSRLLGEIKKGHAKALGGIQLLLARLLCFTISRKVLFKAKSRGSNAVEEKF